jgi:PAS domain S-box-containing protein
MNETLPLDLANYVAGSPIPMTVATPDGPDRVLLAANRRFCDLTGYEEREILGRDCRFLQGEATQEASRDAMRRFFTENSATQMRVSIVNYRKDGRPFVNLVFLSKLSGAGGRTRFLLASQFAASQASLRSAEDYDRDLGAGLEDLRELGRTHRLNVETSLVTMASSAHAIASARLALANLGPRAS